MRLTQLFRDSSLVELPKENRFRLLAMLRGLNSRGRKEVFQEYILPVMGQEAARRVAMELGAETNEVLHRIQEFEAIDVAERRTRTIARGVEIQRRALEEIKSTNRRARFDDDPMIALLWRTIVLNAGWQIASSGPQVPGRADIDLEDLLRMYQEARGEEGGAWAIQQR